MRKSISHTTVHHINIAYTKNICTIHIILFLSGRPECRSARPTRPTCAKRATAGGNKSYAQNQSQTEPDLGKHYPREETASRKRQVQNITSRMKSKDPKKRSKAYDISQTHNKVVSAGARRVPFRLSSSISPEDAFEQASRSRLSTQIN